MHVLRRWEECWLAGFVYLVAKRERAHAQGLFGGWGV